VVVGGKPIRLRPDGTFSFRFSLPDGQYPLRVTAQAADRTEMRSANLEFSRSTDYQGDVGQHPQDSALRPPRPENLTP